MKGFSFLSFSGVGGHIHRILVLSSERYQALALCVLKTTCSSWWLNQPIKVFELPPTKFPIRRKKNRRASKSDNKTLKRICFIDVFQIFPALKKSRNRAPSESQLVPAMIPVKNPSRR